MGAVIRRTVAMILALVAAWVLAGDALGPFVNGGAPLSASALRAALDGRTDALSDLREQIIDLRRNQVALGDRVAVLEQSVAQSSGAETMTDPLEASDAGPWAGVGIVAGEIANAEALNEVFERFASDLTNIRAFQGLLVLEQDALFGRIEALEAAADILDPPEADLLVPDETDVSVPHEFTTGSTMRASEMNANLRAVDDALLAEFAMANAIGAHQAVLEARIEALEAEPDAVPLFTWRIGTYDRAEGLSTASEFFFTNEGPFEPFTITVEGPESYEHAITVTDPAAGNVGWFVPLLPSGTYTATTTYGGVDFEQPIQYDATSVLSRPGLSLGTTTPTTVVVTIGRVEGAAMYDVRLLEVGGRFVAGESLEPFESSARDVEFSGLDLDPSASYYVFAVIANVHDPWNVTLPPQQVDRGASTTDPFTPGASNGGDTSVREYVVGPGRVATLTSIEGVIDGYDGGTVEATFAGLMATVGLSCNGDECETIFSPGLPWVPTSIDAQGAFTVELPASPSLDGVGTAILCGEEVVLSYSGSLHVHDAPLGEPGSSPTASYARVRLEEPKTPVNILADAGAVVWYAYTTGSVDLTCAQTESDYGTEPMLVDVDVRLRPGWNVMTWLQRSEGDDMVLYMRTGEPGLSVPWVVPEQLY
ncbi:MAG: hypothetical protein EA416_00610 [Trueperaceae bacterium]|nr:MAG: hypothetical protein EA416_00610 [Trueperaceae bacterium]